MEDHKFKIKLNDFEKSLLEELMEKRGFRIEDVFRLALRTLHKKEFPVYLKPNRIKSDKPSKFTKESCLEEGGEVIIDDSGQSYCQITHGGMIIKKPL